MSSVTVGLELISTKVSHAQNQNEFEHLSDRAQYWVDSRHLLIIYIFHFGALRQIEGNVNKITMNKGRQIKSEYENRVL